MTSVKCWQQAVASGRGRSALTARDLYTAEKAAYFAYGVRVREMARSGHGVIAHDGLNNRMLISNALEMLAIGDREGFKQSVLTFMERAAFDPVHYSAISHGLQAADGFLKTKEAGRAL